MGLAKSPGFTHKKVIELLIETDGNKTGDAFRRLCDQVKKKYGLQLVIYHYEGRFRAKDLIVIVVVTGKARPETFAGLEELVDRFKSEGNIRKKEVYEDGESEWIAK